MKHRWLIAIVFVCGVAVWQLLGWNTRREARLLSAQRGREVANVFMREGYLHIEIGEGKPWRSVYERLLSERFGIKFYHPPAGRFCGYRGDVDEVMENAMMKANDEEIARRFESGQLERIAEEAERIHRDQQQNGLNNSQEEIRSPKHGEQ
jgi:hypothetical protein